MSLSDEEMDRAIGEGRHAGYRDAVAKSRAKYEPLVERLSDLDFMALYEVVMEQRTSRMATIFATNPIVRPLFFAQPKEDA